MQNLKAIKAELDQLGSPEKAKIISGFFKAEPGGYAEGDIFIGVSVPNQRKIAQKYYKKCDLDEIELLLKEKIHEYRMTALLLLIYKYQKADTEGEQTKYVQLYLKNMNYVNNWDLVDLSADKILGAYLLNHDRHILDELANSDNLWQQRIAIISTFYFIRRAEYADTLRIAKLLLNHSHDLIHKAVGWMLREVGKRDFEVELQFLKETYRVMPRTMLRYAIEKFDEQLRQDFLKGKV